MFSSMLSEGVSKKPIEIVDSSARVFDRFLRFTYGDNLDLRSCADFELEYTKEVLPVDTRVEMRGLQSNSNYGIDGKKSLGCDLDNRRGVVTGYLEGNRLLYARVEIDDLIFDEGEEEHEDECESKIVNIPAAALLILQPIEPESSASTHLKHQDSELAKAIALEAEADEGVDEAPEVTAEDCGLRTSTATDDTSSTETEKQFEKIDIRKQIADEVLKNDGEENYMLLYLAHKYQIKGLLDAFQEDITKYFTVNNVCKYLALGHLYELEPLIDHCHVWIFSIVRPKPGRGEKCGRCQKYPEPEPRENTGRFKAVAKTEAYGKLEGPALRGLLTAAVVEMGCEGNAGPFRFNQDN